MVPACLRGRPQIVQEIAKYLPDKDLGSFALVQRATYDAVIPANAGHWRQRFKQEFELPKGKSPAAIKADYTMRKKSLHHHVHFKLGHSLDEIACLNAIRQLIIESFSNAETSTSSKNIQQLWRFMKKSNLLYDAFRWSAQGAADESYLARTTNFLRIVQVAFFSWNLHFSTTEDLTAAYPLSLRQTAYAMAYSIPLLLGRHETLLVDHEGLINLQWLMHLTNFWKFHLAINDEGPLKDMYLDLPVWERIAAWDTKLTHNETKLGRNWKGSWCKRSQCLPSEVEDLCIVRSSANALIVHPLRESLTEYEHNHISNWVYTEGIFTGGDEFLNLNIDPDPQPGVPWPEVFEQEVHGLPYNFDSLATWIDPPQLQTIEKPKDKASRARFSKETTSPKSGPDAYRQPLRWRVMTDAMENRKYSGTKTSVNEVKYKVFTGTGDLNAGDLDLNFAGIVHPLPPQFGIPGWQRFSMVSFDTPPTGSIENGFLDAEEQDLRVCWRYEGVILPGGNVILGRYHMGDHLRDWEDPDQINKRGPFIYWNVPDQEPKDVDDDGAGGSEVRMSPDREEMTEEELEDEQKWASALKAMHNSY
ncbi:MAG: hypothetical protein Q9201_005162 [Fulgogasparrea decipioides]